MSDETRTVTVAGIEAAVEAALVAYPPDGHWSTGWSPHLGRQAVVPYLAAAIFAALPGGPEPDEDEVMRRLSSDNPRSRRHREEYESGRGFSSWACIPIRDVVDVRAAALRGAAAQADGGAFADRLARALMHEGFSPHRWFDAEMIDPELTHSRSYTDAATDLAARLSTPDQP